MIATIERIAKLAPVSTWALFGAGVIASVLQVFMVLILWKGGWTHMREADQLMYIGILAIIQALSPLAVVVSLSKTRVAAKGPSGFSFDVSAGQQESASPAPTITTTTEIKGGT